MAAGLCKYRQKNKKQNEWRLIGSERNKSLQQSMKP